MKKYDIFLSYRRNGGWETAKHIYDLMTRDGYSVSFDIDTLREGLFDEELLRRIDECTDFVVILDEHVFDRTIDNTCPREKDWLRRELAYAIEYDKNIIPIMLENFRAFPDNLPDDIKKVQRYNGPKYDNYYFDNFYDRLLHSFIRSVPRQTADGNSGCLKVLTDTECRVYIDYEEKGIARPRQIMRIPLCAGSYCLTFESTADKNNVTEEIGYDISAHVETLYQVKLKKDAPRAELTEKKPSSVSAAPSPEPAMTPRHMFEEGEKYYKKNGGCKTNKKALYWYKMAAEHGSAEAMNSLGVAYAYGKFGLSQSYKQAAYWYRKAAEKGNSDAMWSLGKCYEYARGVSESYETAEKLFKARETARNGHTQRAIDMVGEALSTIKPQRHKTNGIVSQIISSLISSEEKKTPAEMLEEGDKYFYGKGVEQNYGKAVYWFKKASEKGNEVAMSQLALCFKNGKGVPKDLYVSERLLQARDLVLRGHTQRAIYMVDEVMLKFFQTLNAKDN